MIKLLETALKLQSFFDKKKLDFCFVGGLAVQAWGEPRITRDVDVSLLTRFTNEAAIVDEVLSSFSPRIDNPKEFALHNRVLLLKEGAIGIDIGLAGLDFEEMAFQESVLFTFLPTIALRIISANNLVVMKAFANRDKDWMDIKGIKSRQRLDSPLIISRLKPLADLKDQPEIVDKLKNILDE